MSSLLASRINPTNPDHHLWNNNGTWWLHCTLHQADFTKRRWRISLGTCFREEARQRRDAVFQHLRSHAELTQSIHMNRRAA